MARTAHHLVAIALTATIASLGLAPTPAHGATYAELHERVLEATEAYDKALEQVSKVQQEIDENEAHIARIEAELPVQRERAADSIRRLYKMQQSSNGLIDLVLSTDDFNTFISTVTYLDRIQNRNMTELQTLADMNNELQEARDMLAARKARADQDAEAALAARDEARAAREEARQLAIAQAEAERQAAEEALARAAEEARAGETFTTASGQEAKVEVPEDDVTPAETVTEDDDDQQDDTKTDDTKTDDAKKDDSEQDDQADDEQGDDSSDAQDDGSQGETEDDSDNQQQPVSDKDRFVQQWAGRIDAYLAGSPLSGYGATFAEAAYANGVDPRVSPAIAYVESSLGAVCFLPHNAWGWGSASWGDWNSAIWGHVSGYAGTYGSSVTLEGAQMYCPPTYMEWYSSVLGQMSCI